MIFCSKNEKGEYAWRLVLDGRKTVTRRLKPKKVGSIVAVQPLRGRKAVGYIKIINCFEHHDWYKQLDIVSFKQSDFEKTLLNESHKEGFNSWDGLMKWFKDHKICIDDCFRIEFELVKV